MSHISEKHFHGQVGAKLGDYYGSENVESEYRFEETGSRADFVVETALGTLCVELENDADSIRDGVGQAIEYAGTHKDPNAIPVVAVPKGHIDIPEVGAIRERIPVIEIEF